MTIDQDPACPCHGTAATDLEPGGPTNAWCGQFQLPSGCSLNTRRLFSRQGYWVRECEACGHRFAEIEPAADHVRRVYDADYFLGGADGYPDYLGEEDLLVSQGRAYARLLARYSRPGEVLDVGAAAGFLLAGFTQAGWTGLGLEPNPEMAEYGRARLGLDMCVGSLEEFRSDRRFDLVTMIQVLPHFHHLHTALQVAGQHTRPGGCWLVETWDRESWVARISGQAWHEYSPPSVLHWFSARDLHRLMARYGFTEVARGRPGKRISLSHGHSLLDQKLEGAGLRRVFLGVLSRLPGSLTIPYPGDDVFWALYQKPQRGQRSDGGS